MSPPPTRRVGPRLRCEPLEDRLTPSWASLPPAAVPVPLGALRLPLNAAGHVGGGASIDRGEVDWYKVTLPAGATTFATATPTNPLDTVIGVYDAAGGRVAANDNASAATTDSKVTVSLAGGTYFFGVTNLAGSPNGRYTFSVDGPAPTPTPVVKSPPPPAAAGPAPGFQITLRLSGLSAAQQSVFQQAADRWQTVIVGDVPDATYNGLAVDDILIDASAAALDGPGGVLGSAGPDRVRAGSNLPIHGTMLFDAADLSRLEATGQLFPTVLHEMGHVLGVGTIWDARGVISGAGTSNPVFTGPLAVAAYDQLFNTTATGVPVENTGGAGTADAHWRESTFGSELMTGYLNGGSNPLTRITVASLGDIGYAVNESASDALTVPAAGSAPLVAGTGSGGGSSLLGGNLIDATGCNCPLCAGLLRPVMEVVGQPVAAPVVLTGGSPITTPAADPAGDELVTLTPAPQAELAALPAPPADAPARPTPRLPVRATRVPAEPAAEWDAVAVG